MRKMTAIILCCSLICLGAYRWGDANWKSGKIVGMEGFYIEVSKLMIPAACTYGKPKEALVYEDIERFFLPLTVQLRTTTQQTVQKEEGNIKEEEIIVESESQEEVLDSVETMTPAPVVETEKKQIINRVKLQEFDYLLQNFYQVDNTTTIGSNQLNVEILLGKNLSLGEKKNGPQVLIYHTHSQEGYKDSVPGDPATSIVGVGDYLEKLLEEKYGIEVLHHKGVYDLPERDNAYSMALPNLEKILKENPTIEVVIDLHRDGVAENRHLVTEVNGKPTAKLMFFNGLSRTTAQGELAYLANPYIADNLAFSFQMQLAAEEYYPGLNRKIYLKGYRYNLHLCPKSILVEVGAQTNTFEEAKNAMEPFADIFGKVLYNDISK